MHSGGSSKIESGLQKYRSVAEGGLHTSWGRGVALHFPGGSVGRRVLGVLSAAGFMRMVVPIGVLIGVLTVILSWGLVAPMAGQVEAQRIITPRPVPPGYARPPYLAFPEAASGPTGMTPWQVRRAYGFGSRPQGANEIIGIVDAYDDPNIEADLAAFDRQFGLWPCSSANGCFRKIYTSSSVPATNASWALEISLDVEWAHTIAPHAQILLVEAASNQFSDLFAGVDLAVRNGASAVSMSWTSPEFSGERNYDNHFAINGVTFFAASGDNGSGVAYPAASPDVVGVGGTRLLLDSYGNYAGETAWSGSGGGLSNYEYEPLYQARYGIPDDSGGKRGVPDVAYNADLWSGYAVYDSVSLNGQKGWFQAGGTSAGAPQWAALGAIANSLRAAAGKARLNGVNSILYGLAKANSAADFHAVTDGENGPCGALCEAGPGYDYVTGLGTPQAARLISALVAE